MYLFIEVFILGNMSIVYVYTMNVTYVINLIVNVLIKTTTSNNEQSKIVVAIPFDRFRPLGDRYFKLKREIIRKYFSQT